GACDDVLVDSVTIRDAFSDGIDPDSCCRVRIVGCDVESDDDALCIKASLLLGEPRACEDVVVRECRLNSPSNGFKIGTETSGDPRHRVDAVTLQSVKVAAAPAAPPPMRPVPEHEAGYPQAGMFGALPASGVYARHVARLALRDVAVTVTNGDARPLLLTDD